MKWRHIVELLYLDLLYVFYALYLKSVIALLMALIEQSLFLKLSILTYFFL